MKRNTVIALVVATGLAATGYGIAVAQTGPAGPGPGRPGQRFRAIPDLTESQRTGIRTLMSEHREAGADQRQKLQEMHTQLNAEVFGDAPNIGRIEELKMEIAGLQADMLSSRIESETRLASLLTPEQRATMRSVPLSAPECQARGAGVPGGGRRGSWWLNVQFIARGGAPPRGTAASRLPEPTIAGRPRAAEVRARQWPSLLSTESSPSSFLLTASGVCRQGRLEARLSSCGRR